MEFLMHRKKYVFAFKDGHTYAWYYTVNDTIGLLASILATMLDNQYNFNSEDAILLIKKINKDMLMNLKK